jgi:signal transduction histidine kinase
MQKLVAEKQSALQIERQRISSDMHDDIGTGLSTMLIYINMLKLRSTDKEEKQNIDRIAILGTALVEQMKEIVWSLSPGNDRLDSLLLFIRQYFVLLFEPLAYDINVVFPATIPHVQLKSDLRRNVFLCVKEALNNVIKHAKATSVELNVQIKHRMLTIEIKDNGSGIPFPLIENTTGNGLKNITRRMNIVKGKCNISNNNGAVLSLELELPPYPNR